MIYLDNAATTEMAPEVFDAMYPYMTREFGNPGSLHKMGREAAKAVEKAREQTAQLFGCKPEQVIFTSGGSEGNSMVFRGLKDKLLAEGKNHIVVSAIEHDSVVRAAETLIKDGFDIDLVYPNPSKCVGSEEVFDVMRDNTGLVSVMSVNNELGTGNLILSIGKLCCGEGVLFHSDCVQAAGHIRIDVERQNMDFATISAHKLHGPKGVGALFVRDKNISPLICGGEMQEFGLRGGTENVAGIVGLGKACELFVNCSTDELNNPWIMSLAFIKALQDEFGEDDLSKVGVRINQGGAILYTHVLSITVDRVFGESLVLMMDSMGVCISAGSACRSHETMPSWTLRSYGLSEDEAMRTVRVSFSRYTTREEAEAGAKIMADCIKTLRDVQ